MSKRVLSQYESLRGRITKGDFARIYLFHGEERFFVDQLVDLLTEKVLSAEARILNQETLYVTDVGWKKVLLSARTMPIASDVRLVVARDWSRALLKDETEALTRYASNPCPSTILVLCYRAKQRPLSKGFLDFFSSHAVFHSPFFSEDKLPLWCRHYAERLGFQMAPEAMYLLIEHVGADLQRMSWEMEKLASMWDARKGAIGLDSVANFVGISREYNILELYKAMSLANFSKAYKIVDYVLRASSGSAVLIIGSLFSFFTKLWQYYLHSPHLSLQALASAVGTHVYFLSQYKNAMSHYSWEKIKRNLALLQSTDLIIKGIGSSTFQKDHHIKDVLYRLIF